MEPSVKKILVIGKDPDILKTVLRLLNDFKAARYQGIGAQSVEEAQSIFYREPTDMILITNGLSDAEITEVRTNLKKQGVPVIQHYGGGSGLLFNELTYFLNATNTTHGKDHSA